MSIPLAQALVLSPDITVADLARALEHTGLAVSNTFDPFVFKITRVQRRLPPNVTEFPKLALLRRQAE